MKSISEISEFLAQTTASDTIEEFLESILTPSELETISARWQLVKYLDKGMSQRKIAGELNLSLCKITRGSKELKKKHSVLKDAIRRFE